MTTLDFIHPEGDLTADMFPGETLIDTVAPWLSQAEGKTDDEDAQAAWVYYRAYGAIWRRLASEPSIVDVEGEGSQQRLISQIAYWKSMRDEQLQLYNALTSTETVLPDFAVIRSRR